MMDAQLPTLRVRGALTDALSAPALAQLGSAELARFLLQRRWFGGKGRAPAHVRVGDVVALRDGDGCAAVARLDVDPGDGRIVHYQLPLTVRRDDEGSDRPSAILARVEGATERGLLFDAVEDGRFRSTLGSAFTAGAVFAGESSGSASGGARADTSRPRWIVEPVESASAPNVDLASLPSRTMRAEQSNTSITFGDVAVMKLFRRLEPGVNPDVEIGRFLTTKTHFTHTPSLLGVARYEGSDGLQCVAGMLQRFLPGSTDAWQHALDESGEYFARDGDSAHPFARDAERLGAITRELHEALASAHGDSAFAPQRATAADVQRWATNARRRIEDAVTLLGERLDAGELRDASAARGVIADRDAHLARLDELTATIGDDSGQLIRHHGDYHLGQVLHTRDDDFQIIDFEGEPARPLAERRERNSALRDVAGMLRSFAYAAATLAAEQRGKKNDHPDIDRRAAAWEHGARDAFLRGYTSSGSAAFLPGAPQRVDALRELFETEKVFYELSYELNNRPEWVWIPIAGAAALRATPAGRA